MRGYDVNTELTHNQERLTSDIPHVLEGLRCDYRRLCEKQENVGSIPTPRTIYAGLAKRNTSFLLPPQFL